MEKNEFKKNKTTFGIIGLGFISDRHIKAGHDVGWELVAGCDIDETKKHKIGNAKFFTDYKEMLKEEFDYLVICTPNYLHFEMALDGVVNGKKIILEKPPVIKYEDLKYLRPYSALISNIFQLRLNPELQKLKASIDKDKKYNVEFEVCVHRGDWYFDSWKNDKEKSGGLMFNIGVHYFDLLCWLFGDFNYKAVIDTYTDKEIKGYMQNNWKNNCFVKWHLKIDQPIDNQYRLLKINGETINLSENFEGLHTKVYQEIINGNSITLEDAEPVIKLLTSYEKAN